PTSAQLEALDPDDPEGAWAVAFSPAVVHPELADGDRLAATRVPAARGQVLGRDGAALVADAPVVEVGVQPSRATDVPALAARLAEVVDVDAAALTERITAASPDAFVPVITLRRSDYDPVRDQLQPLPGTVFRESTRPLAPTRDFARALLGTVGAASEEVVEASEGRVLAGDTTGLSGLQREYDAQLAGTPGTSVTLVRAPEPGASEDAEPVGEELHAVPPADGADLQLSLDARVQQAADAALAGAVAAGAAGNGSASLVAVDVPTGDVLAVANTPSSGSNRALTGQYPPGSTFKAVSTLALLGTGLTPQEVVGCPPTATVDGRSFRNFEGGAAGDVPFAVDFAQSCNTAFVSLSGRLDAAALAAAGADVGLGGTWSLGTGAFTGSVPAGGSAVEVAAATIGQGEVLASPVAMAAV
ncbi:MAG: Cell division protein FtsI [Peptidoglycan synthetase], partial [uncultured Quadrisphaera sp.]